MEEIFTETEITEYLWDCDGDKAPGSDDFNFKFLQTFWEVTKSDIIEFFNNFHNHSSFERSLNSTFLVMIIKKSNPKHINDFRCISLVGCIYKLLSKVLAKQLSKVLNQITSECQHAFVYGHQISDVILIVSETVDEVIRHNKTGILCKFDMEKVFDHVNWNVIDYMLNRMGFGAK